MKKTRKKTNFRNLVSKYLGWIILLIIVISYFIWYIAYGKPEIKYFLTTTITLFTFLFGYKKYERNKELELLDKYGKRYDEIIKNNDYNGLISLWYEEYYLNNKGYIPDTLWKEWKPWIKYDIYNFLKQVVEENNISTTDDITSYINKTYDNSLNNGFLQTFINDLNINNKIIQFKIELLESILYDIDDYVLKEFINELITYIKEQIKPIFKS